MSRRRSYTEELGHIRPGLEAWAGIQDKAKVLAAIESTKPTATSDAPALVTEFYGCLGAARMAQLDGSLAPRAAAAPSPPPSQASVTPQPSFVRTLQRAPASSSRTNCLQRSVEPGTMDKVNRRVEPYLTATDYGADWPNWEIFVITNTCSEIVVVFAAACMDTKMTKTYTGGDGNLPPYAAGAQAGVSASLSGGSGDGAGSVVPPGRKLVIASQGDDQGLWGRHPRRTSFSQVVFGAVSAAAYTSGAIGDYKQWKSDVWKELNRVSGHGSDHSNLGSVVQSYPALWTGANCAATSLASPGR